MFHIELTRNHFHWWTVLVSDSTIFFSFWLKTKCRDAMNNYLPYKISMSNKNPIVGHIAVPKTFLYFFGSVLRTVETLSQILPKNSKGTWLLLPTLIRWTFCYFVPLLHTASSWNSMCTVLSWHILSFFLLICKIFNVLVCVNELLLCFIPLCLMFV